MKKIVKGLQLSSADRGLLLGSALLLIAIRLGLWLLPFRILLRLLPASQRREEEQLSIARAAWSVRVMSRYVPAASCLTQALAMLVLLNRFGHSSELRIGVVKNDADRLKAHAWVECEGKIVIGSRMDLSRYTVLPSFRRQVS
jgi:transglutaminase superfamily protein